MSQKRTYKTYTDEFKKEAVALVTDQGYSVAEAAESLGVRTNLIYKWKDKLEAQANGSGLSQDERAELKQLRAENKRLKLEKEILKKASALLAPRHPITFSFMDELIQEGLPVKPVSQVLKLSRSGYYAWKKRPKKAIKAEQLELYRTAKKLFKESRDSLGSRELAKALRKAGFPVSREKARRLMKTLGLVVKQRRAYKITTKRNLTHRVADNLVKMKFNPSAMNQVWAGDITYLKTPEGWLYLSVVMDLYSRRIIGWAVSERMTVELVMQSLQQAYWLRGHPKGVIFHSDRGSQYTSKRFATLLAKQNMTASMGDVGACWDNAVVERFFGSLKHDWLFKAYHPTRESMKKDVADYMRYYNLKRLHTANGDLTPIEYENCKNQVSKKA
ncbi:IS3 family transposase [Thiosulfatimonas sediminis]|nr:IS3 family transposase [Thiosulfatimonas sediminis]